MLDVVIWTSLHFCWIRPNRLNWIQFKAAELEVVAWTSLPSCWSPPPVEEPLPARSPAFFNLPQRPPLSLRRDFMQRMVLVLSVVLPWSLHALTYPLNLSFKPYFVNLNFHTFVGLDFWSCWWCRCCGEGESNKPMKLWHKFRCMSCWHIYSYWFLLLFLEAPRKGRR